VIPDAAGKILDAIGVPEDRRSWNFGGVTDLLDALPIGHTVAAPELLFSKIEEESVAEWTERFGGGEA